MVLDLLVFSKSVLKTLLRFLDYEGRKLTNDFSVSVAKGKYPEIRSVLDTTMLQCWPTFDALGDLNPRWPKAGSRACSLKDAIRCGISPSSKGIIAYIVLLDKFDGLRTDGILTKNWILQCESL